MGFFVRRFGVFSLLVAGCSTGYIAPDIAKFGQTVEAVGARDAATPAGRTLAARVAAARRSDFARHGVQYGTSDRDACEYNRPDVSVAAQPFGEACTLVPFALVNNELVVAASEFDPMAVQAAAKVVIPAQDGTLLREQLGFGIREDLVAYGTALIGLAKSDDPAAIGTAAGQAFDAVVGLQDAVGAAQSETGEAPPPSPVRKPARTFFTTFAREVAETLRYRRLRAIVEAADPFVTTASVQLAILTFGKEEPALVSQSSRLMAAIDSETAGSEANLAEIESAHTAMSDADAKAAFRGYAEIGRTHRAIREALDAPADLDRLSEANRRIIALAEAFKDLAEAIETEGN